MDRKIAAKVRAQRWYLRFPRGVPVGIFLLVSAITALSVFANEKVEAERTAARHQQTADTIASEIERLANANAVYLRAGAALLSAQTEVNRRAFHKFAGELNNDETLRSGGAIAWAVLTEAADIPALEQSVRDAGDSRYTVHPAPTGKTALPVVYIEPDIPPNRAGVGFDMFSEPVRHAAIMRAIQTGEPIATGPISLQIRSTPQRTGFGIFIPVYMGPPDQRRVRGVIARGFDAQGFIEAALASEPLGGYGVALYDTPAPQPVALASVGPQSAGGRRIARTIKIADHPMSVEVSPPTSSTLSNLSLLTLLFGMLVAALLLVVARMITLQATEDRAALAWFEEQASIRNSLTRELNHRVKNTLANVLSLIALTRRRTGNIDDFVNGLIGRVRALSATHDLLTRSEWSTTQVRDVISAELAPFAQEADGVVAMRGPSVELAPNDALSLGLAIHELATNASKFGALSASDGRVEVNWEMITDKLARIEWAEHGGPPVPEIRHRGFGTELIEKVVAHELHNPVDLRFLPEGVRCTLIVPVRAPAAFQLRGQRTEAN